MEQLFDSAGIRPTIGMEMSSNETIKQAVIAGLGIAFISAHTVATELDERRLITLDVTGLPMIRQWFVVSRRDKVLLPPALAMRDFLGEKGAQFLPRTHGRLRLLAVVTGFGAGLAATTGLAGVTGLVLGAVGAGAGAAEALLSDAPPIPTLRASRLKMPSDWPGDAAATRVAGVAATVGSSEANSEAEDGAMFGFGGLTWAGMVPGARACT
eukprot:gene12350-16463_t